MAISGFSLPLTTLIHENLSIVMTFCFSQNPLSQLLDEAFVGEWKYLRKSVFEISESKATRAVLELALLLRVLDDDAGPSAELDGDADPSFGRLTAEGKPDTRMTLRDACNKIIHAAALQWRLADEQRPLLVCESREPERWAVAEIDIVALAGFCGRLMH